eukprot:6197266-Prymnesium_polylepis.1
MAIGRNSAAAAVVGGKIYVSGGRSGSNYLSSVEVYDPARSVWAAAPSMATVRFAAAAAVVGGKIYVSGGDNASNFLSSVEVYDPARS